MPSPNQPTHHNPDLPANQTADLRDDLDEGSRAPNATVLLVDDDPEIRSLIRTFLQHTGFRVITSPDASRALRLFYTAEEHPGERVDLLIADQYMPLRSGMELALELKQLQPDLPVLLISGGILETAHLNQLSQPGWSFLPKPFSLPDLLNTVHRILTPSESLTSSNTRVGRIESSVGESNTIS